MIVYTVMAYDYEQTDIVIAADSLEEVKQYERDGVLSVWENGIKVDIHYNKDEEKWKTDWKESVLQQEEIKLYEKFLKVNNLTR